MITHSTIQKLREQCGPHAHQVCAITGTSLDHLAEQILLSGLEYIQSIAVDQEHEQHLAESRAFWNWFKLFWYSIDADFVAMHRGQHTSADLYLEYHTLYLLENNIYPPHMVAKKQTTCS